ncbi:MAG: NAD-dependent epimerase/dehydratase family protein [Thermoplasmata archaeon]
MTFALEGALVLVTGGAGYIGSHLCEALLHRGYGVRVLDNLSSGRREFLSSCRGSEGFELVVGDLLKDSLEEALQGCEAVFHLAANQDVRRALRDTRVDLEQNIEATYNLLEAMRLSDVSSLLFTSTSTVYGEAEVVPTPESYSPMEPISLYGASKLACEALISSYCHTFGMRAVIFRFANIVGGRSTHGVVYDFVEKLGKNPRELEILGKEPGTRKSYCYVDDCISGLLAGWSAAPGPYEVFNIGSEDQITVKEVADLVCSSMGLKDVRYRWTGGVDEGRGWKGDVRNMWLDINKLKAASWRPSHRSKDAVELAVRDLLSSTS